MRKSSVTVAACATLLWAGMVVIGLTGRAAVAATIPPQNTSLNTCQTTVATVATTYSADVQKMLGKCLNAIAGDKVKKAQAISVATAKACVKAFNADNNNADPTKTLYDKALAKILRACDPTAGNPKVTHAYDDVVDGYNSGGQTVTGEALHAERLGMSCAVMAGSGGNTGLGGRFDQIDNWAYCQLFAAYRVALRQVHLQYPRGHAWLQEVKPTIEALAVIDTKAQDALVALPYNLRWVDYGTAVYDVVTGLWWEKKTSDGVGIHDVGNTYTWSTGSPWGPTGTAFSTFLLALNGGATGVGNCTSADGVTISGHCNWRLPTVAELKTILLEPYPCSTTPCIDEAVFGPTQSNYYWSATTTPRQSVLRVARVLHHWARGHRH